jgi:sigma-B regulation protein RsbU (phosphoserine phosphatase)
MGSYWLVGLAGNARRVRLSADGPLLVGRGAHNHLVLNDFRISRQHARVAPEPDGFVVYDLNSANGTWVNGVAVRRQQLNPNDQVTFGPFEFRLDFQIEATAAADPVTRRPTEIITKFTQLAPPANAAAAMRMSTRATIPPEGEGSLPLADEHIAALVPVRDSTKFLAEAAPVDLNQLEDAYENLGTLYAFMQAISKTIDRRELLALLADKVLELYPAASAVSIYERVRGALASDPGEARNLFQLIHSVGAPASRGGPTMPEAVSRVLLTARRAIFSAQSPETTSGTTMYAPMIDRADTLGVIYVAGDPRLEGFNAGDLELLNGMAVPAAIMLQNTRMHVESLQRERLNRDLELAAQIQKSFLPREVLSVPGIEFLATYKAAYTVGGDFYDVFWVAPDQLAVFIGDISGKGVAAALLMARISGELRVAALAHIDPVAVLTIMNKAVINRGQPELFFTAIYFTLDVKTGEVWLATAGQPSPYLCHAGGGVEAITEGASGAVGIFDDPQFTATRLVLEHGDSIVLYTDGVVEAANVDGALYGDERLARCLAGAGSRPDDISEHILRSVGEHTRTASANDDLTIFICHRRLDAPPSLQPRRQSALPQPPPGVTVRR